MKSIQTCEATIRSITDNYNEYVAPESGVMAEVMAESVLEQQRMYHENDMCRAEVLSDGGRRLAEHVVCRVVDCPFKPQ